MSETVADRHEPLRGRPAWYHVRIDTATAEAKALAAKLRAPGVDPESL